MKTTIRLFGITLALLVVNLLIGCSDDDISDGSASVVTATQKFTPAPTGPKTQSLFQGANIANIAVTGLNIKWYAFSHTPFYQLEIPRPPQSDSLLTNAIDSQSTNIIDSLSTNRPNPPLPMDYILQDNKTYFATQTINGIESKNELAVRIHLILDRGNSDKKNHSD